MKIEVFVICDAATDQNGKLNLLGTFDTIYSSKSPIVHPQFAIVARLRADPDEEGPHDFTVTILDQLENEIMSPVKGELEVIIPEPKKAARINLIINLNRVKFEKYGVYTVILRVDGKTIDHLPFYVVDQQPELASLPN